MIPQDRHFRIVHLEQMPDDNPTPPVATAIHNYFKYKAMLSTRSVRILLLEGRTSLFIGLVFLALCLIGAHLLTPYVEHTFLRVGKESLLIGGWVAGDVAPAADLFVRVAVADIERGLIDADLGSYLLKQRVALPGRGKSGSALTLLATRFADTLYILFGFEKSDRENITKRELGIYQSLASALVALSNDQIETALKANELIEVHTK